jgi:ferredoxin
MAHLIFMPHKTSCTVDGGTSVLSAALTFKVAIRYGCGAGMCGLCGVRVSTQEGALSELTRKEKAMFEKLGFAPDGEVRLACQAKILSGTTEVDLSFQDTYCPSEAQK